VGKKTLLGNLKKPLLGINVMQWVVKKHIRTGFSFSAGILSSLPLPASAPRVKDLGATGPDIRATGHDLRATGPNLRAALY
jgi:hypothetical protein